MEKTKKNIDIDLSGVKEAVVNFIIPLVAISVSALLFFLYIMPTYKSLDDIKLDLKNKEALESNLNSKLMNINRLLDLRTIVDENSNLVNKVLVSEGLVPGLLTQVDKIARESGLKLTRLNYGIGSTPQSETKVTYDYVAVNLGVEGSYGQLETFVRNIENSARLILIDSIRFSMQDNPSGPVLSINFVLVSPYLYVESTAVTDERIDLDISNTDFQKLINKIKSLKYYDPNEIDVNVPVVEVLEDDEVIQEDLPEQLVGTE